MRASISVMLACSSSSPLSAVVGNFAIACAYIRINEQTVKTGSDIVLVAYA